MKADGVDFHNSRKAQFEWLKGQGFEVVHYEEVDAASLPASVEGFKRQWKENDIPSDGLAADL